MKNWFAQSLHISWHIAALGAGIVAGVALAVVAPPGWFTDGVWLMTAAALFGMVCIKRARWVAVLACLAGIVLGLFVGGLKILQLADYSNFYGQQVQVQGVIAEDITSTLSGDQRIRLRSVKINDRPMAGFIWVSARNSAELKRGDHVIFAGQLREGFGNISATMFRATLVQAKRSQPGDVGRRLRDWFASHIRSGLPEPQASLGIGYLIGQRTALPESLENDFRLLGLTHLVVASGSNLIILVRLLRRTLMRVSKFSATAATFGFIGTFLLITGFSTSMTRAALVASLGLLAWYYGRVVHPVVLLLVAAAITLLIDPSFLWGDLGWHLSFAAFAGVLLLAPLINHYFWGNGEPGNIRYLVVATVAAQIMTFPIIAVAFSEYSPLAVLANLVIQPFVPLAMIATFVAGAVAIIVPVMAEVAAWPALLVLRTMTDAVSWLAASPVAFGEVYMQTWMLPVFYGVVILAIVFLRRKSGHSFRRDNVVD